MMTSKVYYKLLLVFLVLPFIITSQTIFSGYIIDEQTNETIGAGMIINKTWKKYLLPVEPDSLAHM